MKRSLLVAVSLGAFVLAGCEDGPGQTYNPSPAGAGGIWNNGNTQGSANPAGQSFTDNGSTGTNRNEICDAQKKHDVWSKMVTLPIHPPSVGGGIDVAGGPKGDGVPDAMNNLANETWTGLTLDQAEKINCQSTFAYDVYGDGAVYNAYWGDNGEVSVDYLVSTRQLLHINLAQGYVGTMDATNKAGTKYSIGIGAPISKNGQNFGLNWNDVQSFQAAVTDMYNATATTWSAFGEETNCFSSGHCISGQLTDQYAYIWFTTVGFTMYFSFPKQSLTTGATPIQLEQDKTKVLGFTDAALLMQNDAAGHGPQGLRPNVYNTGKNCVFQLGMKYSDFIGTCVAPTGDATKDQVEKTKFLSGITHGQETYGFDVVGFDPAFLAASLGDDKIIQDTDRPADADIASAVDVDQNTVGKFANDFKNNDQTQAQDWHGLGLVTLEWATLIQNYWNTNGGGKGHNFKIGEPTCLGANPAVGCSGLEGIVTTAPTSARGNPGTDVNALGDAPINSNPNDPMDANGKYIATQFVSLSAGLKPTKWISYFCTDGAGLDANGKLKGYTNCTDPTDPTQDATYFKNAFNHLVAIGGKGNVNSLPSEMQDYRFFFKQWIFALVKYLGVADNAAATLAQVDAIPVDQNNLFFDSIGSGQFEFAEYIDRRNVNATTPPLDIRITSDILHAILNDYEFTRVLLRGETQLYSAMNGASGGAIGNKNNPVFLTDVFGGPAVAGLWPEPDQKAYPGVHKYDCATNTTPVPADISTDACQGTRAPTDALGVTILNDDGTPLMKPYKGIFNPTTFAVGTMSGVTVINTQPLIQAATVEVPVYKDPYDTNSGLNAPVRKLIPWLPQGADVGFPVAINGQQDKFIETLQVDFSGVTISANVDYVLAKQQNGNATSFQVQAVETTDFLGESFLCADTGGNPQDPDAVLHIRMYSQAATITNWFAAHRAAETDCGIIYQYSEFGNYLDHVTSTTNGVRLDINPGGGQGRVVGVTLFDPSVASQ